MEDPIKYMAKTAHMCGITDKQLKDAVDVTITSIRSDEAKLSHDSKRASTVLKEALDTISNKTKDSMGNIGKPLRA